MLSPPRLTVVRTEKHRCRSAISSDGCIVCPYHAWAFAVDGTCVDVPSAGAGAPIAPSANLAVLTVRELYGLVWLCPGNAIGGTATHRPGRRPRIPSAHIGNGDLERVGHPDGRQLL